MDRCYDKYDADSLWAKGEQVLQGGNVRAALLLFEQAVDCYERIGALQEAAKWTDALSTFLAGKGDLPAALSYSKRSLALDEQRGDKRGVAVSWVNVGTLHLMMGHEAEALECQQKALRLFQDIGDKQGEAQALYNLGNFYLKSNEDAASAYFEQTIAIAEPHRFDTLLVGAMALLGPLYNRRGRNAEAVLMLEKALSVLENFSDQGQAPATILAGEGQGDPEQNILDRLVVSCVDMRDFSKAMRYCHRGLERNRALRDRSGLARFTELLGYVHLGMGATEQAQHATEEALQLYDRDRGKPADIARVLGQLARIYHLRADIQRALGTFEQALQVARAVEDPRLHISLKGNFGILHRDLGQFTLALKYFEEALQLARRIKARISEARQLGNLGLLYQQMNDPAAALKYLKQALDIQRQIGDEKGQAIQLGNIGQIALDMHNADAAIQYFNRALEINVRSGIRRGEAFELGNLGMAHMSAGAYDKAQQLLQRALNATRALGDRDLEVIQLSHLGSLYRSQGKLTDALATWTAAIEIAEAIEDAFLAYHLRTARGILYQQLKQANKAYADLKASIDKLEFLRLQITSELQKIAFLDLETIAVYERFIALLYDDIERRGEAYTYVRRAKSQVFADQVSHLSFEPSPQVPPYLREEEQQLLKKIRMLKSLMIQSRSGSNRHQAWIALETAQQDLAQIIDEIAVFDPDYADWRQAPALSFDQIRSVLDTQDRHVTLIEFYFLHNKVLMFVMRTGDSELHTHALPIERSQIEQVRQDSEREIGEPIVDLTESWQDALSPWVQQLRPYLEGCELLCIVPHRHLHYLPLHAVMLDGERLIEKVPVVYLPTSRLLELWQRQPMHQSKGCLALGYTDNPAEKAIFEEEAIRVADRCEGELYLGHEATAALISRMATRFDSLHLSCHGRFDKHDVFNSGLDLADGRLTVKDIVKLTLDAKLAVLSACETGRNLLTSGDDLLGLTRSFLFAGTDSLVVSLWKAHGKSTLRLMEAFYTAMDEGTCKAVALQKAQVEVMDEYAHPFYWAPFFLVGDWR